MLQTLCGGERGSHIAFIQEVTPEKHQMQQDPNHAIRIVPHPARLRVLWNGKVVADTMGAFMLYEASYPGVRYIPRADVDMTLLEKSPTRTHCPYKGDASYFSLQTDDAAAHDAIWSYETPFPLVGEIAGYLAFDPKQVEFVENNPDNQEISSDGNN